MYNDISDIESDVIEYNKIKWYIIIYKKENSYFTQAKAQAYDYLLSFDLKDLNSLEDIYKWLSYLKTFKLKNNK